MQFDAGLAVPVARDAVGWLRTDPRSFAAIYGILLISGVGYDVATTFYPDALIAVQFGFMAVNLVIQAWTTLAILRLAGIDLPQSSRLRVASIFGVGLLYGLGVAFGMILLVLPGIYFAARWYLAVPILLAEDVSPSEALSASWDRTDRFWLSCAIVAVLAFLLQVLPLGGLGFATTLPEDGMSWALVVVANAISQAAWLFGVAAATTFYLAIARGLSTATEVFS